MIGAPTAAAICMGPLSPVMSMSARCRSAASCVKLVFPARLTGCSRVWCSINSISGRSFAAPVKTTLIPSSCIRRSMRVAQYGTGQRLAWPLFELTWHAMSFLSGCIPSCSSNCSVSWRAWRSTARCGIRSSGLMLAPAFCAS